MRARRMVMTSENLMARALLEARKGLGKTRPNPMVGCVVARGGRVIATGHHPKAGSAHAEVMAIEAAGADARGADVYVTLEPCDHHGRTGPCTKALIAAGVRRVFVAMRDPNPLVNGRGLKRLQEAGIEVFEGILEDQAQGLNEAYKTFILQRTPFVVGKIAQSLDGKVATRAGHSQWITGAKSREQGQHLRQAADAIVVGVNTVLADNPRLTCRIEGGVDPVRVVLDTHGRTPISAHILQNLPRQPAPTWIVVGPNVPTERVDGFLQAGAEVLVAALGENQRLAIADVLQLLGQRDMMSVLVEGGPTVLGSFADSHCLHRMHIFVAPMLIGGVDALSALGGRGAKTLDEAWRLEGCRVQPLGRDIWITGKIPA